MRIGEVTTRTGVPAKTIRFWEDRGLLPDPARTSSGYRDYDLGIVERLAFIRHAQSAGFTLEQVRQVLDIGDSGDAPCRHVATLIRERLAQVEARIEELDTARSRLRVLARRAAAQDPADCEGYCSIIDARAQVRAPSPADRQKHRGGRS
jgi:DNA-binding transcriptional MerR regulator